MLLAGEEVAIRGLLRQRELGGLFGVVQHEGNSGLALAGQIPVSIFPRWNFLLLAANQLVNHLDKLPLMSGWRPKVIIRVGVGSQKPMYPGHQHVADFTSAFMSMCDTIAFERLHRAEDIVPAYRRALNRDGSTVLVEYADLYQEG